jgi:TatA/E family protein of Tat protein translocase
MGIGELLVVLFIMLLFFGASRLPALGQGLGRRCAT